MHVDKGMKNNDKVTFSEMADEVPNMETGDIVFVVQEKEHTLFKRKGADLLIEKNISLNQALCGFKVRKNSAHTKIYRFSKFEFQK